MCTKKIKIVFIVLTMDPMAAIGWARAQAVSLGPVLGTTVILCLAQWALMTDSCGQFAKAWTWQSRSLKNDLKAK